MPTLTLLGICDSSRKQRMEKILHEEAEKIPFLKPAVKVVELHPRNNESFGRTFNRFEAVQLNGAFNTDFSITIHTDGRILNPSAWTDEFFNYDYVGAPWDDKAVGNGGFCLRSKKLCEMAALNLSDRYEKDLGYADNFICRVARRKLVELKLKFAPYDVASRFSIERNPYKGQFGAHYKIKLNGRTYQLKNISDNEWNQLYSTTNKFQTNPSPPKQADN